ncbi:MAG: hypothetical protein LGB78_04510 [Sulfurovum sp.]|nr:hypothetical protein [Sulfurovum sp.]
MSFNWTKIISLDSSQNNAFEELVCQLAKKEYFENKKDYIKVGNPDGGVECYIVLENGDEIGFQAKWFLSTPQNTQWQQIEESFKTALAKHPNLTKYYVAIPLDRADPRVDNRQSFMDKWNEKVEKWKKYVKDEYNRDIEIEYWGSSELIERLSNEENSGLKKFFFGEIDLSNKWFDEQNQYAIKDLGPRYTPEINVEMDIVQYFDALSRNENFKNNINNLYHEMMINYNKILSHTYLKDKKLNEYLQELKVKLSDFEEFYNSINFLDNSMIDFDLLQNKISNINRLSNDIWDYLDKLNKQEIENKKIKTTNGYRTSTSYDSSIREISEAVSSLRDFGDWIRKFSKLINNPYIILDGEAGIGKSHLLADVVVQRAKREYNSIFLLGQYFRQDKAPWSQILDDVLRLKCNEDKFLEALNSKAEAERKRIIIFIDALNEGEGKSFWSEFLSSFIELIKKYEWLGFVFSVRTTYKRLIIPQNVREDKSITFLTHYGFEDVEYDAMKIFFDYYHIEQPSVPLLHPEFLNPLFLKLFCDGLQNKRLTKIPEGYEGITAILKVFQDGIEDKLIKKYPSIKSLKILDKVKSKLIPKILESQIILYEKAYKLVENIASKFRLEKSGLLDDLISEGFLTKNMQYDFDKKEYYEVVYIAYERFEDHLKAEYLLDNFLDINKPKESFEKEPLGDIFEEDNIWENKGIVEAISIQLPEIAKVELIDMVEQNSILIKAFFESLLWRKSESISENTVKRIVKNIDNVDNIQKRIFEIFFLVASNPKHPFNANLMHSYLKDFSMKERDVWFIPLLNDIYLDYGINPIKRLIDWAWSDKKKDYISDDSLLLTSMALSWLLLTSNRELRDCATKALISILQGRVNIVLELLKKFENINDPYIYERLFAVAFGVVVRSEKNDFLKEIGEYIYETIFNKEKVYPHILLRDYAKNTIDYILYLDIELNIDYEKVKPPYESYFPQLDELPTNEEIDKYEDRDKNYYNSQIIFSMTTEYGRGTGGYGDFGRYVFEGKISDLIDNRKYHQAVSNYATKKIFEEYGYDGEFFDEAEKRIQEKNRYNYDRHYHKIERIGKKYQWIAMYDTLARLIDNFKMRDPSSGWGEEKRYIDYKGAFEPFARNIDPTILLKETKGSWYLDADTNNWWSPKSDIQWLMDNQKWINYSDDLPSPKNSIFFIDDNGIEWISLDANPNWKEPLKLGVERSNATYKQLRYTLNSYLIPNNELNEFIKWAKKQNFWGDWMPKYSEYYEVYYREYYWSEAYNFFKQPNYGGSDEWEEVNNYRHKVGLTNIYYFWECLFDYSKNDTLQMYMPSKILFNGLKLRYAKKDGYFIDEQNDVVCFNPSIDNKTNPSLLVKKDILIEFLKENNLTLVWTIIGEKQVIPPSFNRNEDYFGVMQMSGFVTLDGQGIINLKESNADSGSYNKKINIQDMKL